MTKDRITNAEGEEMYTLLEALAYIAPTLQKLFPIDNMVGVTDKERFVAYIPGDKLAIPGEVVGMEIPPQDAIYAAIRQEKYIEGEVPPEAFGIHFKATAAPIRDSRGNVVGGLGLGISLTTQNTLIDAAAQIASTAEEISATTEELAASATELARIVDEVSTTQKVILAEASKTDEILNMINQIAGTSRMLGLNAAIEAARAGEAGRGFNVVAEEIRKMADGSAKSVKQVKEILSSISLNVEEVGKKIQSTLEHSERQAAVAEEIASSSQEFARNAAQIEAIAKII